MYSPQGYASGPVPVVPAMNNPGPYFGNTFPTTYLPGFVNNCPFPPPFVSKTGIVNNNNNANSCNINAFTSIPPPGFNTDGSPNLLHSQRPPQVPFASNGFVNPPLFGATSFLSCPVPFPNSTTRQPPTPLYSSYQPPNYSYPPPAVAFTVPPPPIPHPSLNGNANYSKFSASNSHSYTKYQPKMKHMPLHCETCDRDFPTEDKHKQHVSEHITCGIEGCTFSAHMKVVEKHISLQHRSGLFSRIVKGNSPEEIAKWIMDRKRQFPTQERIEKKQAQKEEMDKRGERYTEPRNKFNNRYSNDNRKHNGLNKFGNSRRFPFNKRLHSKKAFETDSNDQLSTNTETRPRRKHPVLVEDDEDDDRFIRNLAPFKGTAYYLDAHNDSEIDSFGKNSPTICSDSITYKYSVFDVFDSDAESNDVTNNCTSPARSEISFNEVGNNCSSLTDNDVENYEINGNCPSPVQSKDQISLLKSCDFNDEEVVSSNLNNSSTVLQDCEIARNDFLNLHGDIGEAGTDVSYVNNCQDASIVASPTVPIMSTSLDLLKAYHFSDDEEESNKTVEMTKTVLPDITPLSDDNEPEECSSKICPRVESVVSDEKIVSSESVGGAEESDSKKNRKRKRHKDTEKNEESKTDKEKPNVPDLMNHHKRNRRPTLLEKLLANEIKHERNVILQCVRYVVQNNYFEMGQTK